MLERAHAAGVGSSRAVLGRWTRVAVAAAGMAALLAGALVGTGQEADASFDAEWVIGLTGSATAAALLTALGAPDATILFASTADN